VLARAALLILEISMFVSGVIRMLSLI